MSQTVVIENDGVLFVEQDNEFENEGKNQIMVLIKLLLTAGDNQPIYSVKNTSRTELVRFRAPVG
jgi:hypothetical protein